MFKDWWDKIKAWILAGVEKALLREIDKLDRYEAELADLIREKVTSEERATKLVDFVQEKLSELVTKAFDSKWLSRSFFQDVEDKLHKEIAHLDKYEDDLAAYLRKHLNADEKSKLVVDFVQEHLKALVHKYIQKI